ncbi:MAG: hypothetical protein H6623_06195 [Bdellovibrionaceae bacterium]|nr:hypothetical protein [Pseudobdellovibrionaceae bacterium]
MAKSFSLQWVFEPFEREITFFTRPMFGGLAVYVHGRMVMVLMESPGDKSYRDQVFPFDIWNGVLLPTDRPYHASLKNEYASLVEHPVLGKWLYLPMLASTFEVDIEKIAKQIRHNDERYGVVPSMKKRQKKDAKKINKKKMRKKTTKKKVTRAKSKKVARKKVKRK